MLLLEKNVPRILGAHFYFRIFFVLSSNADVVDADCSVCGGVSCVSFSGLEPDPVSTGISCADESTLVTGALSRTRLFALNNASICELAFSLIGSVTRLVFVSLAVNHSRRRRRSVFVTMSLRTAISTGRSKAAINSNNGAIGCVARVAFRSCMNTSAGRGDATCPLANADRRRSRSGSDSMR